MISKYKLKISGKNIDYFIHLLISKGIKILELAKYQDYFIIVVDLEDYKKMDKLDKLQLGVIYIGNDEKGLIDNKEELFTTIPEKTNCRTFIFDKEEKKNDEIIF